MVETAIISFLIGAQLAAPQAPVYRVEREPVGGGAELVTLFEHSSSGGLGVQSSETPLLSVLRDTLGSDNPGSARLRYVWILTSTRPTLLQRTASALSFVWFRTGGMGHADRVPSPVIDLAAPSKTVWSHLAGNSIQALQFDGLGIPIRSSTRSYRGNFSDYRQLQIYRALGAMNVVENQPDNNDVWPKSEFIDVYSRLSLADRTFGGLVRQENLTKVYNKETSQREEIRAHNWELLRQRAEANGLYFDPLALPDQAPTQAMLWIARNDLEGRDGRVFDRRFLSIADPWKDDRLAHWTGYSETRYFDPEGRPVVAGTPGARAVEMIPLALYGLDYPRVPLLLVDFRSSMTAKRRELFGHLSTAVITGVLGITTFGNFTFLAASSGWTMFEGRHGAPTKRNERLRSYSEAREFLAVDTRLAPRLKTELRAPAGSPGAESARERRRHGNARGAGAIRGPDAMVAVAQRSGGAAGERPAERIGWIHAFQARAIVCQRRTPVSRCVRGIRVPPPGAARGARSPAASGRPHAIFEAASGCEPSA